MQTIRDTISSFNEDDWANTVFIFKNQRHAKVFKAAHAEARAYSCKQSLCGMRPKDIVIVDLPTYDDGEIGGLAMRVRMRLGPGGKLKLATTRPS